MTDTSADDLSERLQTAERTIETLLEENRNLRSQIARLHETLKVISAWGLDYNAQDLADIARAALQEGEQSCPTSSSCSSRSTTPLCQHGPISTAKPAGPMPRSCGPKTIAWNAARRPLPARSWDWPRLRHSGQGRGVVIPAPPE